MLRIARVFCALFVIGLLSERCWSYKSEDFVKNYPAPHTAHNKVMGLILAFNLIHIDPLIMIFNEYLSMCEAGWDPTVVVFTTVKWTPQLSRLFRQKMYCYQKGGFVNMVTSVHDPSIGLGLGAEHRQYMGQHLGQFDVFIYHEDDIVVKLSHLAGYMNETKTLHQLMPTNGLQEHLIGFQRFRRLFKGDGHAPYNEQDVIEQELLEEMPDFRPVCIQQKPYLHVHGNIHQAMWILTQQQVLMLQEKCTFLNQSSPSREYMSSFSLFDHKQYHCGMNKLIPADRFMIFAVLHYYQQRHISWTPVFLADENIRAGFDYHFVPRTAMNVPECWKDMVDFAKAEQEAKPPHKLLV